MSEHVLTVSGGAPVAFSFDLNVETPNPNVTPLPGSVFDWNSPPNDVDYLYNEVFQQWKVDYGNLTTDDATVYIVANGGSIRTLGEMVINQSFTIQSHPFEDIVGVGNPIYYYLSNPHCHSFCAEEPVAAPHTFTYDVITRDNAIVNHDVIVPSDVIPMFTIFATQGRPQYFNSSFARIEMYVRPDVTLIYFRDAYADNGAVMINAIKITADGMVIHTMDSHLYDHHIYFKFMGFLPSVFPPELDTSVDVRLDRDGIFGSSPSGHTTFFASLASGVSSYNIDGTVSNDLSLSKYEVSFLTPDNMNSEFYSKLIVDTSVSNEYSKSFGFQNSRLVVCQPYYFVWDSDRTFSAGDVVISRFNVDSAPYYFEALNSGTSGLTEPTWNTAVDGQTTDNTITWVRRDHLVRPQIHGPVVPYAAI